MKGGHQHVRPMHKGKATQRAPHRVRVHLQPCPLHAVQQLQALFQAPPSRACSRRPVGRHCPLPLCPALPVLVHLLCANIACCTFKRGKHSRSAFPRKLITFRRLRAASGWDSRSSALKTADSVAGETSAYACAPSMILTALCDCPWRASTLTAGSSASHGRVSFVARTCMTRMHASGTRWGLGMYNHGASPTPQRAAPRLAANHWTPRRLRSVRHSLLLRWVRVNMDCAAGMVPPGACIHAVATAGMYPMQ